MLVRLLYVSRSASEHGDMADLIMQSCRRNNPELGITGVLCHGKGLYLQVLEGGREQVNRVYANIVADRRHSDVMLLSYEEIRERRFSCWMGLANLAKINASMVLKYSPTADLNPYAVPGSVSLAFVEELMACAAVRGGSDDTVR